MTGLHAFGGYCMSAGCTACDGACVGTARGELCMAACTRDADCRANEGYVCDPAWKACVMPNATALVPRTCVAPRGIGRDPQFAPTEVIADAIQSSSVLVDGRLVTVVGKNVWLARDATQFYKAWSGEGVQLATSRDGIAWSAPTVIDPCADCKPMVVTAAGAVHVMFANEGLRVRTSRDGGKAFGAASTIALGGYANAAVGADGRLHVVAVDEGLGGYGSAQRRIQYVAQFGKPTTVSQRDETLPYFFANPSIAVDSRRKWLYVAYVRGGRAGLWDLVLAASKDAGKTWTRTRIGDDPPCAMHLVPNLALDPTTGTLHVAWYDTRGDQGRFAHAACTPGLAKCTQLGRINDVPFAGFSTVPGKWIGDYATLLVDDKRRLLHAVWTQPVADAGKIVSRVFHAVSKLPLR
jgi:hypothetical protein